YWAVPELKDLALLSNSLRHAAATLNVASTSALDSAVVDTPVVCVGFHPEAPERENRFYHDVHFSHHFLPILQSGAAPLVKDMSGLREALADAIGHRGRLKEARARLVADLCGRV